MGKDVYVAQQMWKPHVSFKDFYNDALNDLASDPQMVLLITDFKAWRLKRRDRANQKKNRARSNSSGGGGGGSANTSSSDNSSKAATVEDEDSTQRWAREAMFSDANVLNNFSFCDHPFIFDPASKQK